MNLFKFARDAGEAVAKTATSLADGVRDRIGGHKTQVKDLKVEQSGEKIILGGSATTRAEAEKAIIAAGNTPGIAEVESRIEIAEEAPAATFYTVKSGDTLSKIAKAHYGDASKYPLIFNANTPMLSDPDRIYAGQTLRIPPV